MRLLTLGLFIYCAGMNATGQCPVQPLQASVDATGKHVTIRYHNSGTRIVQDVHLVLTSADIQKDQSIIANFSARGVLRPQQDRTAVFPNLSNLAGNESLEVLVEHVSFSDHSIWTWRIAGENPCRVPLSRPQTGG